MAQIHITASPDPGAKPGTTVTQPGPITFKICDEHVAGMMEFVACLAYETDVLIPAVLAIVACITSSAPPAQTP